MKSKKLLTVHLASAFLLAYFLFFYLNNVNYAKPEETKFLQSGSPLPSFTLKDTEGRLVSLESFKGKVVLIFFGYTNCLDVCPMALKRFGELEKLLGERAESVVMIFITTDPFRDTPGNLKLFISRFSDRVIALTGSWEELTHVWTKYYVRPLDRNEDSIFITHSALIYIGDRNLILRQIMTPESPAEEMLKQLEKFL